MHADTKKYHAARAPSDRKICKALAEQIERALPEAENRVWHAHPVWFLDGNPIVGYSKLKDCVRLLFWSGQSFRTKGLQKEGSFKAAEARYTDVAQIDAGQLARWLAEARVVQWDYKNIVKRKGKLLRLRTGAAAAAPKLLSGGNPQIAKGDGDEAVQAFLAAMPGWKREVGRRLDALIARTAPKARKAVRWNSPFYGIEGQGWFLSFHCITKYVKVTFFSGTSLRPMPPVVSKSEGTRYLHIHEHDAFDEKLLTRWIKQAAKQPGANCF